MTSKIFPAYAHKIGTRILRKYFSKNRCAEPLLEHISDRFLNQCIPVFQFGVQWKNEGHMWKYLSCVVAVHIFGNGTRGGLNWFLCFSVDYRPIVVTAVDSCERRRHGWDRLASQARFSDQREKLNRLMGGFPYFKSAPLSVHLSSFDFHFYLGSCVDSSDGLNDHCPFLEIPSRKIIGFLGRQSKYSMKL